MLPSAPQRIGGALCSAAVPERIIFVRATNVPKLASQIRVAFSSIASNTGSSRQANY